MHSVFDTVFLQFATFKACPKPSKSMPANNAKRNLEQDNFLRAGEPATAKARVINRPRKRVRETTAHSEQTLVEPFVSSGIVQPVLPNSGDEQFSSDDDPMIAKRKKNQKKRVIEITALEQRPLAKPKATRQQQRHAKAINEEAQQRLTQFNRLHWRVSDDGWIDCMPN